MTELDVKILREEPALFDERFPVSAENDVDKHSVPGGKVKTSIHAKVDCGHCDSRRSGIYTSRAHRE